MALRTLGIDPGSRTTGFAVLELHDRTYQSLACDILRLTGTKDPHERLILLYEQISLIVDQYAPDYVAVETPIYGKDPLAMLKLGRAQASIIMAVLHKKVPLFEYYPKAVKKAITGNGNARKQQVAYMLQKILQLSETDLPLDATDALAVAWCHMQKTTAHHGTRPEKQSGITRLRKSSWESFVEQNPKRIRKS